MGQKLCHVSLLCAYCVACLLRFCWGWLWLSLGSDAPGRSNKQLVPPLVGCLADVLLCTGRYMHACCRLLPHVLGSMHYTLQWLEWLFNWSESGWHVGAVHSTHFV